MRNKGPQIHQTEACQWRACSAPNRQVRLVHTDDNGHIHQVYIKEDKEMTVDDLRKNQRHLNGHVSMLLKVFGTGANWEHQQRLRESMINEGISVSPLWLLYKCHKGWTAESGKVLPTRPVAGGNIGMNFALSELVSWVLEPLATAMDGRSELVSGEDLKSNVDKLNVTNTNWVPI